MRRQVVFSVAFVAVALVGFRYAAKSQETDHDLLRKIEEARKAVKKEAVHIIYGVVGTRRVRVSRHRYRDEPITGIVGREMAIAVMDESGAITVARAVKDDSGLEVKTSGVLLYLRRENGINSDIACERPANGKVLAVKYPVSNEGNRFGPGPEEIEAVYTPYSGEIRSEEVIKRGVDVQREFIDKAYAKLRSRGVGSRAFEGKAVADVISKDTVTVLLMNEHIDPGEFTHEDATKPMVERVLTVIGTNRETAYQYSISSAGAHGLVQMIPSTYSRIVSLYPAAQLAPTFAQGVSDPVNAIMAQVLLCDADWHSMRAVADIPASKIGPYLAAAYNGGVGRVISVLSNDETEWMDSPEDNSQPTKSISMRVPVRVRTKRGHRTKYVVKTYTEPIFRAQTNKYVRQYHWINNYFARRSLKGFRPMADGD